MTHSKKIISLRNVGVSYDGHTALEGVNLDIYEDDFIGIIGPNGGGKSSLVKAIMGNVKHSGEITFDEILRQGNHFKIGYMPQVSQFDMRFPISIMEVVLSGLQTEKGFFGRYTNKDRHLVLETLEKMGLTKDDINLRIGAFGAEPWTENMRKEIEERLGLKGYNIYGLSEIMGPGVSYECQEQNGSHICEDHFYPEIINPDTLEQLPYGEQGELVFTTLTKEGMPLLRYRTKDLCTLMDGKCACGRTAVRMGRIVGRSDDMLIIRGINVFPSQVESVILEMPEFEPQYMLIVNRENNLDTLQVQVEVRKDFFSDDIGRMLNMKKHLADRLKSVLSIAADVRLMEPNSIERSQGKGKHVIDNRNLK